MMAKAWTTMKLVVGVAIRAAMAIVGGALFFDAGPDWWAGVVHGNGHIGEVISDAGGLVGASLLILAAVWPPRAKAGA